MEGEVTTGHGGEVMMGHGGGGHVGTRRVVSPLGHGGDMEREIMRGHRREAILGHVASEREHISN